MPVSLHGSECFLLPKADVKTVDFVVTRFLIKLFLSANIDIVNGCRSYFNFLLPSDMIAYRKAKFEAKFINNNSLLYYFGLC